jgi:mRNA-degrading endonuclease YafQ of YafQ-DinJ toxin-antitoxin module
MIELVWDEAFVRAVKKWQKKHPELMDRFKERLRLFSEQPFHPS